jgi:iron complex outermembrane receptor protein
MGAAFIASLSTAAAAAERDFSIPAQPLASALKSFGEQSGQAILYRREIVLAARSPGVSGRLEPEAALTRLLDGTALEYRRVGRGYVLLRARPPAAAPGAETPPPSPIARPPRPRPVEQATAVPAVVVTGTLVRGVAPAGSAVIDLPRETIQAVSPTNVKEVMATLPQMGNFGTNAEQSTPNRFRNSGYQANIHNLGIYATLTLLNGHRVAAVGTEGTFADPSTVPTIALERVELIADGASAIYGSDAVAGVVNFIYRKPFDGLEVSATYGFNDTRYEKRDLALIGGRLWPGGGLMAAYEYSDNRSPLNVEVPTLALGGDQTARGGRDLRSTSCPSATTRAATAAGAPGSVLYGPGPAFSVETAARQCDLVAATTVIPDGQRHAVLITGNHALTNRVKGWGEINYGRFETRSTLGRPTISVLVPRTNPFFNASNIPPNLLGEDQVYVSRSGAGLCSPTTEAPASSSVFTAVAGLDIDLSADWKATLSLISSSTRDYWRNVEFDARNIIAAVNDPNPATALNLFGQAADNNPATLARIDNGAAQRNWGQQQMRELRFTADGPMFEAPGGSVRAAVGALARSEQLHQLQTGGSQAAGSSFFAVARKDDVRRAILATFAEFNVPLVGPANAGPLLEALSLSVSGRYDVYDGYGGKFNPKYGLVYSPVEGLRFRGSYGTNFAAPVLGLLTQPFGQPQYNISYNSRIAYGPYAGVLMNNVNAYIVSGGSKDLEPEEARTRSFGFDYAVAGGALANLRFGASWYQATYSNLVYKIPVGEIITNPTFAGRGIFFPTQAEIAAAIAQAPPASPLTSTNFDYITRATLNLGTRVFEGVDFDLAWRLDTERAGAWRFAINANLQTKYDQEVSAGTGFVSRLGTQEAVEWKTRYTIAWSRDPVSVTAFVNYIDGYDNTSVSPAQRVDAFVTTDVTAAYELRSLFRGVTLQVRAANLFDAQPPFFDSAAGYNPGLASPFGRTIDLTLRAAF